jgi:peptidyl-prolyl cis-trans isomerase SurA
MYKLFLILFFVSALNAQISDGVAVVVKGEPITLLDIEKEMKLSKVDSKTASDILIRKALEKAELEDRKISVTREEVYEDIKQTAARNNMSVDDFYEAVRNANGLTSSELKEKIKEKLLSQKLHSSIAYANMSQPSEVDIEEYYKLHKDDFNNPSSFTTVIYKSSNQARLQEKIDNPMFYSPDISTEEQVLPYDRISPELASLLSKTPMSSFTPVVPDGKGGFMSFYIKSIESAKEGGLESARNQIINKIMSERREQVLGDYFARLRHKADIKMIRTVE